MENLTYLERIREVYPKLKGVEKKVVEYIMQNPERIIKLSWPKSSKKIPNLLISSIFSSLSIILTVSPIFKR